MRAFWFHYNKPLSKKRKRSALTLHYDGKCVPVCAIDCKVPTYTRNRKTQPYCVMAGVGAVSFYYRKTDDLPEAIIENED